MEAIVFFLCVYFKCHSHSCAVLMSHPVGSLMSLAHGSVCGITIGLYRCLWCWCPSQGFFCPSRFFFFFLAYLSVIAYSNVIKSNSNLATVQKSRLWFLSSCPRLRNTAKEHLIHDTQNKGHGSFYLPLLWCLIHQLSFYVLYHLCFYVCALWHMACLILWQSYDFVF